MVSTEQKATEQKAAEQKDSVDSVDKKTRSKWKRWGIIITILLLFIIGSFAMTKIIYDGIFKRYDIEAEVPDALRSLIELRESVTFYAGDYELQGYLYAVAVIPDNERDDGAISETDDDGAISETDDDGAISETDGTTYNDGSYPVISGTPLVVIVPG